jgi:hypothetical protein
MSQQYDNTNKGVLFRNDRKTQDSHPTHSGSINIDGKEFWLSAWVKDGNKGKFFSLSVKPKDAAPQQAKAQAAPQQDHFDDDIPF